MKSLALSARNSSKCSATSKSIKKSKFKNSNGRSNRTLYVNARNKSVEILNIWPSRPQRQRRKSESNFKHLKKEPNMIDNGCKVKNKVYPR